MASSISPLDSQFYERTALGEGVLEFGSQVLSHEMKLLLVMVDGRIAVDKLALSLPQVADVARVMAELLRLGFVRSLAHESSCTITTHDEHSVHNNQHQHSANDRYDDQPTVPMHRGDSRILWQPTVVTIDEESTRVK
jgi:hypothetical protein